MNAYLQDELARMAAVAHHDSQGADKRAAYRHGRDRSTVNRWRNIGRGSPVHACLDYLRACDDPMRVVATVMSAARLTALAEKTTAELLALYWDVRKIEALREHEDRALDSRPPRDWSWSEQAAASERDVAANLLKASIERIFAVRRVPAADVCGR